MQTESMMLALFLGLVALVSLVAIVGGFLHYRRDRMLTHAERMKALEAGRDFPDDATTARVKAIFGQPGGSSDGEPKSLARRCYSTAIWVGFWGFVFASQGSAINPGVSYAIAASAGAVGVAAVICGTILATREIAPAPASATAFAGAKPPADPDALDVAPRRG